MLLSNPFPGETIHPGPYRMGKRVDDVNTYRVGHPLAQRLLGQAQALTTQPAEVIFHYGKSRKNITILEPLVGRVGWLSCARITVSALETEDQLAFAGVTDDGAALDEAQCGRLFDLPGTQGARREILADIATVLDNAQARLRQELLDGMTARNGRWFDTEMDKLDRWAEDRRATLKAELEELDEALKETKKAARLAPNLPEKLERQREVRKLEAKRYDAWRSYDQASRDLDRQKDALLDEISQRLQQHTEQELLFTVRWAVV
jgi:hypothetical protein